MRILLDTHIFLWSVVDTGLLSTKARTLVDSRSNDLVVSAVTIWEIAIKHRLRRGSPNDMPISGKKALHEIDESGIALLAISPEHSAGIDDLPLHGGDPFDRMLVVQAKMEEITLLTHDKALASYGDFVVVV